MARRKTLMEVGMEEGEKEKPITVVLTERERGLLLEALNRVPIQGLEVMQLALGIASKLLARDGPSLKTYREEKEDEPWKSS